MVDLVFLNLSNYFNILLKGNLIVLFVGLVKGDYVEINIFDDGDYVIWVFLMCNVVCCDE